MAEADAPVADICEATGLNPATIYNWIEREGWSYAPSTKTYDSKLARQLDDILAALDESFDAGDLDVKAVAERVGVSASSVYRTIHEHRAERWEALSQREEAHRRCTGSCGQDKPLDAFPPRTDRVGKRHAMCFECREEWARGLVHNPDPIREGARRRRARLRGARTDHYTDAEVAERDGWACWFCDEPIERALAYPDRGSLVIHHLHPVSKRGPDIASNVAAAHLGCNHEARDRYACPFEGWAVAPIPYPRARDAVVAHHYLHRAPRVSFAYGLVDLDGELRGAVTFGTPSSRRIATSACEDPDEVIELNRLWIADDVAFGAGSWFLSRALRQLDAAVVVAYADLGVSDPRYGTVHDGGVYRACSFAFAGTSRGNVDWRIPGLTRNVGKHHPDSVRVEVSPKRRYWTLTGSRSDKRRLRQLVRWPSLDYPSP